MAKRRKRSVKSDQILYLIAAMTAIATAFMIFAPTLGRGDVSYTGLNIAFGKEITNFFGIASGALAFDILAVLAYALPLAALIVMVFLKGKVGVLLATILTVTSLVLFIAMPDFVKITIKLGNTVSYQTIDWQLQWGWTTAVSLISVSC